MFRLSKSHQDSKVFFVELFFDLVFVYAVTQISHYFFSHFHWQGLAETIFLLLTVWWVWIFTAWVTNWLDPQKIPVRLLLFVLMLLGLGLSISIPHAFHEAALPFALCYSAMQVGRSVFMCCVLNRKKNKNYQMFLSVTLWFSFSAVCWIKGAVSDVDTRYAFWLMALVMEYLAPVIGFRNPFWGKFKSTDWNISNIHMSERCALFVILSLGESLLETGAAFAEQQWSSHVLQALFVSFVCLIAMWWLYFSSSIENPRKRNVNTSYKASRAYTYTHIPIVVGIILSAISDELIIEHPDGATKFLSAISILGGAISFLVGNAILKYITEGIFKVFHLVAAGFLFVMFLLHPHVTHLSLAYFTTMVLVMAAALEHFSFWEIETTSLSSDEQTLQGG